MIESGSFDGMEKFCRSALLRVAKRYGKVTGLHLNTVSRRFHGAVGFLGDFQSGKVTITLRKYDQMMREFRREWPKDKIGDWPV